MNVDFLQVSMDVVPRVKRAIHEAEWKGSSAEVLGWLMELWTEEVCLLNDERPPEEHAVYASYRSLRASLLRTTNRPEKEVDALLHALILVGFFDSTNGSTGGSSELRICGMSRYFELTLLRKQRREAGKKAGKASGKARRKSTTYATNESFNGNAKIVEPSEVKLSEVKLSKNIYSSAVADDAKPNSASLGKKEDAQVAQNSEPTKKEHFVGVAWADAVKRICDVFLVERKAKYAPTGRDFKALEAMGVRTHGDFKEVERRWRLCLQSTHPVLGELWQLEQKFNQFAGEPSPKVRKNFDIIGAESVGDPW